MSDADTWRAVTTPTAILPCNAVELRVDLMPKDMPLDELAARRCSKPLLLTVRHASEGGGRAMEEPARRALALSLLSSAAALDWEIARMEGAESLLRAAHDTHVVVVASAHDFEKTPPLAQLLDQERRARASGADIVKFAFRLHSGDDLLVGAELLRRATGPVAVMGMGPLGPVSRLLYAQLGSVLVYGYLGEAPTAPGQWSAKLCLEALANLEPLS